MAKTTASSAYDGIIMDRADKVENTATKLLLNKSYNESPWRMCRRGRFLLLCLFLKGEPATAFLSTPRRQMCRTATVDMRRKTLCTIYTRKEADDESIIDAVIEDPDESTGLLSNSSNIPELPRRRKRDIIGDAVKGLTELSLLDYQWRSSLFKTNEAERLMEESLARMRGEDASYVRPMDATDETIGPLGKAERKSVEWLSRVIEEEGKRAERILKSDGKVVRPIESVSSSSSPGPLADLEKQAVEFIDRIRDAEKARVMSGTVRPKDMDESMRGPLGETESRVMEALEEIRVSEKLRYEQSKLRKGEIVRPIDVPGPLGELERAIGEVIRTEQLRSEERELNEGAMVRPMEASVKGLFGDCEEQASKALKRLTDEEQDRLRNVQRYLQEMRPMEIDRDSPLGAAEAVIVGILRAPRLLASLFGRVKELMESESMSEEDKGVLDAKYKLRLPTYSDNKDEDDIIGEDELKEKL